MFFYIHLMSLFPPPPPPLHLWRLFPHSISFHFPVFPFQFLLLPPFLPFNTSPPPPPPPLTPSSCSLPSIRSGLPASSSHFPAAAIREESHTTASALREEGRLVAARERGQNHAETGLPARLQHTQMYEAAHIVFRKSVSFNQIWVWDLSIPTHPARRGWTDGQT